MAGFGFRKNSTFEWNSVRFRVRETPPNGELVLESVESGAMSVVRREHLLDEYAGGRISWAPGAALKTDAVYSRPLCDLPQAVQREAARRYRYLQGVWAEGEPIFTNAYLSPIVKRIAAEMGDTLPPSVSTFFRWHRRFRATQDTRSLIPRHDKKGRKRSQQPQRLLELAADSITDAFNASPLSSGKNIHQRLLAKITAENSLSFGANRLVAPSQRTTYRLLAKADLYDMTSLREGKPAADKRFRITMAGVKTTRILERVEIDHTPLDLFLVDERTWLPIGRPTLTMLIDHYSRMPLGYYLSFGDPSAAAVVGALRHAILPKKLDSTALPDMPIEGVWPCYGLMEVLVVDNGLEFLGSTLEAIAMDLHIRLQFCPARQPRFKGTIERYLKTVNYHFAHQLPGASFARFHLRGDYDPQQQALLTFGEFKQLLEKWIVDVYAQDRHRGIDTTPLARWNAGLAAHQPELPADLQSLQRRIGESTERKLRRTGFELHGIRYNGHSLERVLRRYGEGVTVRVVFDPEDLGEVQVWAPDEADPVQVRAIDFESVRGLSVRQNAFIRELARESGATAIDAAALQRARASLFSEVQKLATSRKLKARRRSAAIQGISNTKPDSKIPQPINGQAHRVVSKRVTRKKIGANAAPAPEDKFPDVLPSFELRKRSKS